MITEGVQNTTVLFWKKTNAEIEFNTTVSVTEDGAINMGAVIFLCLGIIKKKNTLKEENKTWPSHPRLFRAAEFTYNDMAVLMEFYKSVLHKHSAPTTCMSPEQFGSRVSNFWTLFIKSRNA